MPLSLGEIQAAGFRLEELPREGRCLIACKAFQAGATLLVEKPLVGVSSEDVARRVAADPGRFSLLRASDEITGRVRKAYTGFEVPAFLPEVETNTFLIGGRVILFHGFAMLNHACAGSKEENSCFSVLFTGEHPVDDQTAVRLIATRDIAADEPVRISYHELFADADSRAERLQAHCAGNCGCSLCVHRDSDRDLLPLHQVCPCATACQCCGSSADRTFTAGDLVLIEGLSMTQYNGLFGRVLQKRADGRLLVCVLRHAVERQLWMKASNLEPVDPGGKGLLQCSKCSSVSYCSRDCQRTDWREHKRFCDALSASWEKEFSVVQKLKLSLDEPEVRKRCSYKEALHAFQKAEYFISKWTQHGRAPHLPCGHQAINEVALFAVGIGTLALGRLLCDGHLEAGLWIQVANVLRQHQRSVLEVVPKFHLAHWTALYHMRGLIALSDLRSAPDALMMEPVEQLTSGLKLYLDVVRAYDADAAEALSSKSDNAAMEVYQAMAADPEKLARFHSINADAPLDERMRMMEELLRAPSSGEKKKSSVRSSVCADSRADSRAKTPQHNDNQPAPGPSLEYPSTLDDWQPHAFQRPLHGEGRLQAAGTYTLEDKILDHVHGSARSDVDDMATGALRSGHDSGTEGAQQLLDIATARHASTCDLAELD